MLEHAVDLDREIGDRRQVDVRFRVIGAVIAVASARPAAELAGRGLGDDRQRAAFGVAAEQRALRALQDLDPLDVEERGVEAVLAAEVDAVDIDADALLARGLVGVQRHDAADADGQCRLARLEGRDAERRDAAVGEVAERLDVAVLERLRTDHRDRDRRPLEVGLGLGRGDDDVLQALAGIGDRLGGRLLLGQRRLRRGRGIGLHHGHRRIGRCGLRLRLAGEQEGKHGERRRRSRESHRYSPRVIGASTAAVGGALPAVEGDSVTPVLRFRDGRPSNGDRDAGGRRTPKPPPRRGRAGAIWWARQGLNL